MTMDLRNTKQRKWLLVEENYSEAQFLKKTIMERQKEKVLGSTMNAAEACEELLETVVAYLTREYPSSFEQVLDPNGRRSVKILETQESVQIAGPGTILTPLQSTAYLAMEDLNILLKGEDGQHVL